MKGNKDSADKKGGSMTQCSSFPELKKPNGHLPMLSLYSLLLVL